MLRRESEEEHVVYYPVLHWKPVYLDEIVGNMLSFLFPSDDPNSFVLDSLQLIYLGVSDAK